MKCPACGFDSPDDAICCDFCKEPFRKRPAAPPPAPIAVEPIPAPKPQARNGAPVLLPDLDPGERIPAVPPWARYAAWAFLGVWFVWGMILLGYYLAKRKIAEPPALPAAEPAP